MPQTAVVMLKGGGGVAETNAQDAQRKPGLSTAEAARILGVAKETVRRWIDSDQLKGCRINPDNPRSERRADPDDVERKRLYNAQLREQLTPKLSP